MSSVTKWLNFSLKNDHEVNLQNQQKPTSPPSAALAGSITGHFRKLLDESKRECPACKLESCVGCQYEQAFLARLEQARLLCQRAKELWQSRFAELVRQGFIPDEAIKQASREVRESAIWREGMEI